MSGSSFTGTDADRNLVATFPQPVAAAWTRIFSESEPSERENLLFVGFLETLARCLAATLLADLRRQAPSQRMQDKINQTLSKKSLGSWWELIRALIQETGQRQDIAPFFRQAYPWYFNASGKPTEASRTITALIGGRNVGSHGTQLVGGRGVSSRLDEGLERTRFILGTLDWWAAHTVFEVIPDSVRDDGVNIGHVRRYIGVQPPVVEPGEWTAQLVRNCPYLQHPGDEGVLDLSPWMTFSVAKENTHRVALVEHLKNTGRLFASLDRTQLPAKLRLPDGQMHDAAIEQAFQPSIRVWQANDAGGALKRVAAARSESRFERLELLGRGGFGHVYKARDRLTDAIVAVKVFGGDVTTSGVLLDRIKRESRIMQTVSHPRILAGSLHDDGGQWLLEMKLMVGSLDEDIGALRWSEEDVFGLAEDMLDALVVLHEKIGKPHCDVKPSNLLRDAYRHVYLADFGFAEEKDDDPASRIGMVFGTPAYMAPEQMTGVVQCKSDLYSLARVLDELASGERRTDHAPGDGLRGELGNFLAWLGAKDVGKRPDAKQALEYLLKRRSSGSSVILPKGLHPADAMRRTLERAGTFEDVNEALRSADPSSTLPDEFRGRWNRLRNQYIRSQWPRLRGVLSFADVFTAEARFNKFLVSEKLRSSPVSGLKDDSFLIMCGEESDHRDIALGLLSMSDLIECVRVGFVERKDLHEKRLWQEAVRAVGRWDARQHETASSQDLFAVVEKAVGGFGPHNYRRIGIPKRDGRRRWLDVPHAQLAAAQKAVIQILTAYVVFPAHTLAFVSRRSAWLHALHHAGAAAAVKVDIHDFFGSVSDLQVLTGLRHLGVPLKFEPNGEQRLSYLLTTTHHSRRIRFLPQGAPSSPFAANVAGCLLDAHLVAVMKSQSWSSDWKYSRYADDMVISSGRGGHDFHEGAEGMIKKAVQHMRWHVTDRKTRHWSELRGGGLKVCGLAVPRDQSGFPALSRERQRIARAALHRARYGKLTRDVRGQLAYAFAMTGQHAYAASASADIRRKLAKAAELLGVNRAEFIARWCSPTSRDE